MITPKESKFSVDKLDQTSNNTNTQEQTTKTETEKQTMNNTTANRQTKTLTLIDDDSGIETENSIVGVYQAVIEGGDVESAKQELLMGDTIKTDIEKHNKKRVDTINLDILNRTGNEVKLRAVKLKDLTWEVK